jgi:hypothetical protein
MTRLVLNIDYAQPKYFDKACDEQEHIGWKLTMKGLLSSQWAKIQEEEYAKIRAQ